MPSPGKPKRKKSSWKRSELDQVTDESVAASSSQPAQAQERAEKLTRHILEVAATKVVPVLIMMI